MGWGFYGGQASKSAADEAMPFLGGVRSFPTTAFVSAQGDIIGTRGLTDTNRVFCMKRKKIFEKAVKEL